MKKVEASAEASTFLGKINFFIQLKKKQEKILTFLDGGLN
jgi:hypothetical protein